MVARPGPLLIKSVHEISRLNRVLTGDTLLSHMRLKDAVIRFNAGEAVEKEDISFLAKITIRALLGQIDGLGYAMRRAVLVCRKECGLVLANKEIAKLGEKKYDPATDTILAADAFLNTPDSITGAFSYFPRLIGTSFKLDKGDEGWRAFRRLVKVRNRFTHPETLEDLLVVNALAALLPATFWIFRQLQKLFAQFGVTPQYTQQEAERIDSLGRYYKERDNPFKILFKEEDFEKIRLNALFSLKYVTEMRRITAADTLRLFSLLTKNDFPVLSDPWAYTMRAAVRALFSDVEAIIAIAQFFINAAEMRGDIVLAEEEKDSIAKGEIEDKFASSLTLFSRKFGCDYRVRTSGDLWKAFRGARFLRNKLTHPKKIEDLQIDLKRSTMIWDAVRYFKEAQEAFSLDAEKLAPMRSSLGVVNKRGA